MNTYWNRQKCLVSLLCLLAIGCQKSASERLAEEREKTKSVLVELERVVLDATGKLREVQDKMERLLKEADRAMLDGRGLTVSNFYKLDAAMLATKSGSEVRKLVNEASEAASIKLMQMGIKKEISKDTADWAKLECDKIYEKFVTEARATNQKMPD